jgi:hypothetical protein
MTLEDILRRVEAIEINLDRHANVLESPHRFCNHEPPYHAQELVAQLRIDLDLAVNREREQTRDTA